MARPENVLYFVDGESSASDRMRLAVLRARSLGARLTFASVIPANNSSFLGDILAPE